MPTVQHDFRDDQSLTSAIPAGTTTTGHPMRRTLATLAVLAVAALAPATASAAPVHQYTPAKGVTCRTHYRKHIRNHHRVCVRVAAPKALPTVAAPVLAAQLDPSFTQDTTNPLLVTYQYSASATINGVPDPNLPAGVLNLYSDGDLVCSIPVGGSVDGGSCRVTYLAYGGHSVIVTYSSGVLSTTQTDMEVIPAPPADVAPVVPPVVAPAPVATTTTLTATPDPSGAGPAYNAVTTDAAGDVLAPPVIEIVNETTGESSVVYMGFIINFTRVATLAYINGRAYGSAADSYAVVATFAGSDLYLPSTATVTLS